MFCFDALLNAWTLDGSDQTHLLILHVGGIAIDLERTVRDSTPQGWIAFWPIYGLRNTKSIIKTTATPEKQNDLMQCNKSKRGRHAIKNAHILFWKTVKLVWWGIPFADKRQTVGHLFPLKNNVAITYKVSLSIISPTFRTTRSSVYPLYVNIYILQSVMEIG